MKVTAINGSPRKDGNTAFALKTVARELENAGIEVELIHIGHKQIRGCRACGKCGETSNRRCVVDDIVNELIPKVIDSDGLLLGSPVYWTGMNGTMKAFLDRLFFVSNANGNFFRHKVGASVVAVRRSGGTPTYDQLNKYLQYAEMYMPASNYWGVIHGRTEGEAEQDKEGIQIMRILGKNMAWLMKAIDLAKQQIPAPEKEQKEWTHFIR
ncbi:MAG: flavodoxin family protein [Tannerella sp.]|jgi:multimeric flavodoxin WrbA|nr:flavodoxin family protein [Tannerella sp.]